MNDQQNSTYALHLQMLHDICHETTVTGPNEAFDKLIEYGWIEQRVTYVMKDSKGRRLSRCYIVTAQGIRVLTPRENRVIEFCVPFFPESGCLTADGQQICILADYLDNPEPEPAA